MKASAVIWNLLCLNLSTFSHPTSKLDFKISEQYSCLIRNDNFGANILSFVIEKRWTYEKIISKLVN